MFFSANDERSDSNVFSIVFKLSVIFIICFQLNTIYAAFDFHAARSRVSLQDPPYFNSALLFENLLPTMSTKNATDETNDLSEVARYFFIVVGAGEVMSGVIGNLILLAMLLNRRSLHLRNVHNLLLANLALADLVAMGYWFPFVVLDLILGKNFLSENICRINAFVMTTCVLVRLIRMFNVNEIFNVRRYGEKKFGI